MNLVLAVTGATGAYAARLLMDKSPWPITLVASPWGQAVYTKEGLSFDALQEQADQSYADNDLAAPIASGSVPTAGMVILPCTTNTLAKIAAGIADTLITRAAHCHLKEKRPLVLGVRESPWTAIDFGNAERLTTAGATVMPLSPPFYMVADQPPRDVTMHDLLALYVDRVLDVLGHPSDRHWGTAS